MFVLLFMGPGKRLANPHCQRAYRDYTMFCLRLSFAFLQTCQDHAGLHNLYAHNVKLISVEKVSDENNEKGRGALEPSYDSVFLERY